MQNAAAARVLVVVADGSESLEAVTVINVLRRGGLEVQVAGIGPDRVIAGTRGIRFVADVRHADVADQPWDLLVLPGGEPGARALAAHAPLIDQLRARLAANQPVAAICAAPALVLAAHGLLAGRRATGYPAFRAQVPDWQDQAVVSDGALITSQGPGTAIAFALALLERLSGRETRNAVAGALLVDAL